MSDEKICFVIAPIGDADSETRRRSDQVLRHIVRPAVETRGYTAIRADEIDKPGIITSQVIQHIVSDALVVADLTERNPNVFYELAIRHALRKPFIQLIKKGEQIPFDVAGTRTISVDHHDLDSVETAKMEIARQVDALEADTSDIETPISVSLDLQLLRQSEDPEERSLADLVSAVGEVRASLSKMEGRIESSAEAGDLEQLRSEMAQLPHLIQKRLDTPFMPRRGVLLTQDIAHEFIQFASHRDSPIGLLLMAGALRETFPWIPEIAREAYRELCSTERERPVLAHFEQVLDFTMYLARSKRNYSHQKNQLLLEALTEEVKRLRSHGSYI